MNFLEIPVRSDSSAYEFQIILEGVVYTLSFSYNERMDRWIMDIKNDVGDPLQMGIVLLMGGVLNSVVPGIFFLNDTKNGTDECGRDDLGTRFQLIYAESA